MYTILQIEQALPRYISAKIHLGDIGGTPTTPTSVDPNGVGLQPIAYCSKVYQYRD